MFPVKFIGRVSGKRYKSPGVGFCENGPDMCDGVFIISKTSHVHFDDTVNLSCSLADARKWLADPQHDALRARGDVRWLAMLKLESHLIRWNVRGVR